MKHYFTTVFLLLSVAVQAQRGIPLPPQPVKTDMCAIYDTLIYVLQRDSGLFVSNGSPTRPVQANVAISAGAYYALANQTDTLWVGTSNGLFRVLPGGTVNQFSTAQGNFAADTVFSLAASGNLLYAGTNAGLLVYNGSNWTTYNTTNSGLTSNRVTRIKAHAQRLGMIAGGAAHVLANNVVQALTVPSSLPLQFVQPLPNGEILVATTFTTFVRSVAGTYDSIVATAVGDAFVDGTNTLLFATPRLWTLDGSELHFRNIDFVSLLGGGGSVFRAGKSLNNSYYFMGRFNILVLSRLSFIDDRANSFNRRELDINQVKALYLNGGDMFWDRGETGTARYNVPKQTDPNSVVRSTLFAFSPWFGGMHNGQLYQSAQTYRQSTTGGIVYRSGPLTATGDTVLNNGDYDRLWKINRRDIEFFKDAWSRGTVQNGGYTPAKDIREWPGNRPGGGILAPFFDRNNDGLYRWQDGDYPLIKGDQAVWMVYNDKDMRRTQAAAAMELEVQCMAYAYTCNQLTGMDTVLNYTTFLDYSIHNRSNRSYSNSFVTLWTDGDLGNYLDDFVGMDVKGNGYYFYNGDDDDEGFNSYGFNPPAQGVYVLKGPTAPSADGIDNNRNGVIDEAGEDLALSSFVYFNNDGTPIGNPTSSQDFYNYSRAIWKDNTPMVYGGTGYPGSTGSTTLPAKFMFPGATDSTGWGLGGTTSSPVVAPFQWSEVDPGPGASPNVPADRRGLASMGPFNFNAGGTESFTVAFIYSRGNNGANSSRLKLINQDAPRIKQWFAQNQFPSCLDLTGLSIGEVQQPRLQVTMYPNPSQGRVSFRVDDDAPTAIELFDMQGRKLQTQHFAGETTYHLNVDQLPAGMYLVHVKQAKGIAMLKLLLQP
jgi:hypothetical protein